MLEGASLLTHSEIIGTTSLCFKIKLLPNSYQNSMGIRKLICFAVITLISMKQRCSDNFLKQLPQPRSASACPIFAKNPCSFCCILFHRTSVLFSYQKLKFMVCFFSSLGFQLNISLWYMHLSLRTEGMHLDAEGFHHIIYLCLRFETSNWKLTGGKCILLLNDILLCKAKSQDL